MSEFIRVAACSEIPEDRAIAVEVRGKRIALFNAGGTFYAIENSCLHMGVALSAGKLYGTRVVCPLHGWEYDITTGANVDDPKMRVASFAVKIEGDNILIEI
jgi:3-phenylpropionate/trans-cinnamate dioxygenase ferredoxin component